MIFKQPGETSVRLFETLLKHFENHCLHLCSYQSFAITIPLPRTPGNLHQKFAPTLGLLHPSFCPGGFVGAAPERWAFVYKRCLPFSNFHYNGKFLQLTTLWGLLVAPKFYTFLKKIIQS